MHYLTWQIAGAAKVRKAQLYKNDRYKKKIRQFKQAYNAALEQLTVEDSSSGSESEENNGSGNESDRSESTTDFAVHAARVMSSLK